MNLFQKTLTTAAFVGAMVAGSAASAATFDFTGANLSDTSSIDYTVDGITVTVTAGTFSSVFNPSTIDFSTRLVDIDPDGLGADGSFDSDQVDGSGGNDVLVFSFSEQVTINTIGFGNVDSNDDFAFGSVAGSAFDRVVSFQDVFVSTDVSSFASLSDRTGLAFGIGAIGAFDNFTITSLDVSAVPLPASGLLLLAALGAGAGIARRRKSKAA